MFKQFSLCDFFDELACNGGEFKFEETKNQNHCENIPGKKQNATGLFSCKTARHRIFVCIGSSNILFFDSNI